MQPHSVQIARNEAPLLRRKWLAPQSTSRFPSLSVSKAVAFHGGWVSGNRPRGSRTELLLSFGAHAEARGGKLPAAVPGCCSKKRATSSTRKRQSSGPCLRERITFLICRRRKRGSREKVRPGATTLGRNRGTDSQGSTLGRNKI